jgi:hypothetical protein
MMDQWIERLKQKVVVRGAHLNPTLTVDDIVHFEQRYRIKLPNGYRNFLLHLGNGGDGPPHYGFASLPLSLDTLSISDGVILAQLQKMHLPFPFIEPWVWEDEELPADDVEKDLLADKHAAVRYGILFLGDDGCGQLWQLIITGPERGNVWLFTDVGITPTNPKRNFLTWYEDWLDGITSWWL